MEFFFFSSSYFVQTLSGDIFPAEIAMSKFSLIDGVHDTFNMFVNPGALPLGMASEAKDHSEKTHRFTPPPNIEGEQSYEVIFRRIMTFVGGKEKRKLPPIFVEPGLKDDDLKAAQLTLEKIVKEGGDQNIVFRVYPMEHLLYRLHKKCAEARDSYVKPFSSVLMAKSMMGRDDFSYADIGCEFHLVKDANYHCCLSKVKRWGYMIARLCLDSETDAMISGRHVPEKALALTEDEVQSTISHQSDSEWASDLTNSFKSIRITATSARSVSHITAPSARSVSRISESTASIHSIEKTQEIAASTTAGSEYVKAFSVNEQKSVKSYRQLISRGE